ncbi:MAG: hypothetical protein HY825_20255 [Acidobacteria bacterium]|nr:hypothetical protein [Acidobacteriota bacterium]
MRVIRDVFTQARPIDRRIEKVIDYAATDEARLEQEISEYEVTASVERALRRFIEAFDDGARLGTVTEIGVWVSGFYGSGKSSLTKYLGLALDSRRKIKGVPFVDRLADRIPDRALGLHLKKVAKQHKAAIFMLDLGTDQLAESASDSVANVLYWNVLKELGFSKEKKVADLEIRLEQDQKLAAFEAAYEAHYPGREPWRVIHDDPMLAVTRASALVPAFYPDDFKTPADFRQLRYQPTEDVKELARRIIALVRRRTGCEAIVFFVDEVGQYVAPRRELILNLDGLVRAFKEAGQGKVWFVATAQQTLTEISERASLNSAELFKLKDRFPISLELLATDIREITAQRLLKKNADGEAELKRRYQASAELLELHTHLTDWQGGKGTLDADTFASLYPFLPSRLDLVLDLIRALARRTGGTGLRSAIRLVTRPHDEARMLGIEYFVRIAVRDKPAAVVVIVDAEERCVARTAAGEPPLGPELLGRARAVAGDIPVAVVVANRMFEAWFLADFHSLRSRKKLPADARFQHWRAPETVGGCKGWLEAALGVKYRETVDQGRLAADVSLPVRHHMRGRAPSFHKLYREVDRISRAVAPKGGP